MALVLETPVELVNRVTTIQVTGFVNNREEQRVEVHYITLLEDGTPYQRGQKLINGYDDVKAFYTEFDNRLSNGLGFGQTSKDYLYELAVSDYDSKRMVAFC